MKVKDLFKKNNVVCPKWLSNYSLEDDWNGSVYSKENNIHKWSLKNEAKNVLITFDGEEYHFKAFDSNGNLMYDNIITENYACDC